MFFKIFSFIFYAGTIKPVLTFECFGSVFGKLKLKYKFLIGLFVFMLEKQPFRVDRVVSGCQ